MTNTDTADIEGTAQQVKRARARRLGARAHHREHAEAAAAVPHDPRPARRRWASTCRSSATFTSTATSCCASIPACAEALAKYRINPGNVGRGSKRDPQFAEMIEFACRYDKPVRIGVNWGSLDQDLLDAHDGRERARAGAAATRTR